MTKLKVETGADNPILRKKSKAVSAVDKKTLKFVEDMKETLESQNGLGLAAPQVSQNIRVIVVRLNNDTPEEMIIPMINPKILSRSLEKESREEGCFSLPGLYKFIERAKKITVKFVDKRGGEQIFELEGLNARVVQHEVDHLDGILIVDHAAGAEGEAEGHQKF